jgi:polyisoprenoid-binding protein YceI
MLLLAVPARADQLALTPPSSQVELRAYGLGLLPLDGKFTRFHGWMRYEPSNPTACQVILEIEARSLAMEDTTIRETITGPDFMDATQFPDLAFHGACQGNTVAGSLTLHGQTHPFALDLERSPNGIIATGRLKRAEWGITSHPFTGGSTIRIRVQIPNPLPAFSGSRT